MKIINNKYRLLNIFKKDDYGKMYVASDLSNNNKKILFRTIETESNDKEFIDFLTNKFIYIASINHLYIQENKSFNVIDTINNKKLVDLKYFYTAEYIEGRPIDYKLLSMENALEIFIKLCYALNYLHFRGISYRLLNFENIINYGNKSNDALKIMNLVDIYQQKKNINTIVKYNNQFIAPEIRLGEKGDFTSDIYSLGVVFFYLVSGLDYKNNNFRDIFKENRVDGLDEIINRMTTFQSTSRYKSIIEVINDLKQYLSIDFYFFDKGYYERLNFNIPIINRKKEKDLVLDSIKDNCFGRTKNIFIFIHGEAGIGKTRFVKEINFQIQIKKINVCSIELSQESNQSLYVCKKILRYIVKNNIIDDDLIRKYGSELVKILPDLSVKWNVKPSETLSEEKELLRISNRVYNFIKDFTLKNPLVIIVDNIQYAYKDDLNILEYIIKNAKDTLLTIICTYTDEDSVNNGALLNEFKKEITTKFIQLSKLNFEEISLMVQNILGVAYRPLKLTTKIMEETNGNPRHVEEIMKSLFMDKKILVDNKRVWGADIDDICDLELPSSIDDARLKSLDLLDPISRKILNVISIFHSPVSVDIISKIVDIHKVTVDEILKKLVFLKIINENFQDWGYSYDYYDKQLKRNIYNNINYYDKKVYHFHASNILEDFYISEGRDYTVELIYHLTNCNELDRAVKYCIKAAEKMEELHIYNQANVFYNRAIYLLDQGKNIKILFNILMKMGLIYFRIGQLNDAFKAYSKASNIASKNQLLKEFVDAQNKIANTYFYKNEYEVTRKILKDVLILSRELNYIDGELEASFVKCRLYAAEKTKINLKDILDECIDKSLRHSKYLYAGEFFNEKGKLYYDEGKMLKAKYCYEQSIFFFEKSNNSIKTTRPLNNIGVIYLKVYKKVSEARKYYFKALRLFEKYNYIIDKGIFLLNIGETFLYEDNYSDAIHYFNESINVSLDIDDKNILFALYIHLCDTYLNLYEYDKSYFYLKKMELEFNNYSRNDVYYYDYYIIHIDFFTQIYNYSKAEEWHNKLSKELNGLKFDFDLQQKIKEFQMYRMNLQFHKTNSKNINEIKQFLSSNIDKLHSKPVRYFLNDWIYILIMESKYDLAKYFIELDANLINNFNSEIFDLKRDFVLGLFCDNKIHYYKNLLNDLSIKKMYIYEWKVYKIIGDEYYKKSDYFNALSNYVTALDILKNLTYKIPEEFREEYIFNNNLNYVLKERIENLKSKILYNKNSKTIQEVKVQKIIEVEDFFDFSDLNKLFKNKEFMKSIYKESRGGLSCQITELKDLIQNLKKDELYNIQLIMRYCANLSLAERGFVFITNENNDIEEVIYLGKHKVTEEIKDILRSANHKDRGIIVTNENQFNKDDLRHSEIKSLICIPIKKSEKDNYFYHNNNYRRKHENRVYSKEIVGYLYLDTKGVFNNFTYETFNKCCLLDNLLYIMIENYNLKKTSSIDELTKLYLRKHIEDLFKKELLFSKRNELNLSVIMCDIDKFKNVNDLYGHRKGDEVLEKLGVILKKNLRKTDLAGRYGGEEFIIILPETDPNDAFIVCEKLRKSIEEAKIMDNNMDLTLSFGISSYPIHGASEEELIEKADQALYKSKKSGRNKTTIWNENIGFNKQRYDKLVGIITGNISNDYRNVNIIIDIIELLKKSYPKSDRIFKALGYMIEISESKYGAIFEIEGKVIKNIYARERTNNKWLKDFKFNPKIIEEFIGQKQGDFFIDWNDISQIDTFKGVPSWNSYIIIPIIKSNEQKGILLLSVPINEKEFDFSNFNLINSLSGVIASMM